MKGVARKYRDTLYITLDKKGGPSKARNEGARKAVGEYIIFFDSDVVLKDDTIARFLKDFNDGEDAVAGEYDIDPVTDSFFARFKALLTESWTPSGKYVSVFALRAAGIKRELFERAGGFDEDIKTASVEDFEFGSRLSKLGAKIFYDPGITVRHHHPGFLKQAKLFYLRAKDWAELFLERGGMFDNWCASPSEGVGSMSGLAFIGCLILRCFFSGPLISSALILSFIVYISANIQFLKIVRKRRGILFIPVAIAVKLPLSAMVALGFFSGAYHFIGQKLNIRR
jgi:glycosyltransferase involved in cell wall biosynthesis